MSVFERADARLLPGFERRMVQGIGGEIRVLVAGDGPPLLMLHGDPQTHLCWHRMAPRLAERHTVVLTDLRGRGESHKPDGVADRQAYAKRVMAEEQRLVMRTLGFRTFAVAGHDRGARVARRMALDHPQTVERLVVMDIIPALDFYQQADSGIAQEYFYFFFLTQPSPLPERLIAGDPRRFMDQILNGLSERGVDYEPEALELYLDAAGAPEAIQAMCSCFRAGYHIDVEHDRADRAAGRRIGCPTQVLWGEAGVVARHFDPREVWRGWASDVQFALMPCGHFIPEEAPAPALEAMAPFLAAARH